MVYTDLARELATEFDDSPEDVLVDLMSVMKWHGWSLDLNDEQVELARREVADRVEVRNTPK